MIYHFKMSYHSVELRKLAVEAVEKGLSQSEVARRYNVNQSLISRWIKLKTDTGDVVSRPKSGRPKKISKHVSKVMKRQVIQNPRLTAVDISNEIRDNYDVHVTPRTVRNYLIDVDLNGRRSVKKPLISKKNRMARLAWAREHKDWTSDDWKKVLWSDESKVNLFGSDGIQYVRRPKGKRNDARYQTPTVKYGGGNVMIWGCFSANGVGPLVRINGKMDSKLYTNILEEHMLPFAEDKMPAGWIFQQDNDPKHTSRLTTNWFETNNVQVLKWPAQSPDLNPIEHLWDEVKRRAKGKNTKNADEKFRILKEAWDNIDYQCIRKLIDSMPRRCAAVIQSRGYATKY